MSMPTIHATTMTWTQSGIFGSNSCSVNFLTTLLRRLTLMRLTCFFDERDVDFITTSPVEVTEHVYKPA